MFHDACGSDCCLIFFVTATPSTNGNIDSESADKEEHQKITEGG